MTTVNVLKVQADQAVQASLVAAGAQRHELHGRWAEAVLVTPQGTRVTLHMNPDSSGFLLFAVGERVVQQITWESASV